MLKDVNLVNEGANSNKNEIETIIKCLVLLNQVISEINTNSSDADQAYDDRASHVRQPKAVIKDDIKTRQLIRWYIEHKGEHGGRIPETIQSMPDAFKIIAWIGTSMAHSDDYPTITEGHVVSALMLILFASGKKVNTGFFRLVEKMLKLEKNDADGQEHGIGRNGLYLIFKAACITDCEHCEDKELSPGRRAGSAAESVYDVLEDCKGTGCLEGCCNPI